MNIDDLIKTGENLLLSQTKAYLGYAVPFKQYDEWKRVALMYAQSLYPKHPQIETMEKHVAAGNESYHCQAIVSILKAFRDIQPNEQNIDYDKILKLIFERFHRCAQQLRRRHSERTTIEINDEYDVQDLLQALLKLHFDDVRVEESVPTYAGGASRIDFLLKDEEIAIEVKMTRDSLKDKEIGDQLIIDIAKYKEHPNCKVLYCFVYDPDGIIRNPRGLAKDLEKLGVGIKVRVFIRPED